MQLDAAEVRDPGERGGVVEDREDGRVAARERHRHLVDIVRVLRGYALLVEEIRLDAVRESLHVERAPAEMGEGALGDVEVVLHEVALRQPGGREEHLVGVRDRDLVTADAHTAGFHAAGYPSWARHRRRFMMTRLRLLIGIAILAACAGSAPALASQSLSDTNTTGATLAVNAKGEALVTYSALERHAAARARLGRAQRALADLGAAAGAVQVRLHGRLGEVPEVGLLEDVQERVPPLRRARARRLRRRLRCARRVVLGAPELAADHAGARLPAVRVRTRGATSSTSRTGPGRCPSSRWPSTTPTGIPRSACSASSPTRASPCTGSGRRRPGTRRTATRATSTSTR